MYEALASADGARFRKECKEAGKSICAWTVNLSEEMRQCARWGILSIISDKPDLWKRIKNEVSMVDSSRPLLMKDIGESVHGSEANSCNLYFAIYSDQELVLQLRA